jgi:hypothetical protein
MVFVERDSGKLADCLCSMFVLNQRTKANLEEILSLEFSRQNGLKVQKSSLVESKDLVAIFQIL